MSQQASRTSPATVGNTARALSAPLANPGLSHPRPVPGKPRKGRTPLSLVVSTPKRSSRSLVTILFLVVLTALAVVLVMSISVSKGQYELVGLTNQQSELHKINQTLQQEIAAKQAPQELVANAAALGMVPAGTTGQIDVRTKQVSGSPQPASGDTKGLASIPPALIDNPVPVASAAQEPAAVPLSPAAQVKEEASARKDAPATVVPAPPVAATPDLHGGTIPAPLERDGL